MYRRIKWLIRAIIPQRFLYKLEPSFRFVNYQFYKGNVFQCNICDKKLREFILLQDFDKLCPFCGSLPRARRLYSLLKLDFITEGIKVLDFSPSRSLYRVLKSNPNITYNSTDISGDFLSDFQYDITNLDIENESYDLIICYHILEHIDDDLKAMNELFRVVKKGGHCIVQTPFKEGAIYEDSSISTEAMRLKHFGQEDHVRVYSANGLMERLRSCGFKVSIKQFEELPENTFGYKPKEEILICTK